MDGAAKLQRLPKTYSVWIVGIFSTASIFKIEDGNSALLRNMDSVLED